MWKFPKTYELTISFEHLPISETKLKEMILEWETTQVSFLRPFWVLDWKTKPEALGHSGVSFHLQSELKNLDRIFAFFFPNWFAKGNRERLTKILRERIPTLQTTNQKISVWQKIESIWKEPIQLQLGNLIMIKASLEMEGIEIVTPSRHLQIHQNASHIILRVSYLKNIQYRFYQKRFKPPYPKFAECYIQTRDKHNDNSLGRVFYHFLGYLLEKESDEYLLPYFGFQPIVPKFIRELIPNEIWNALTEQPTENWVATNLKGEELEFRPVYPVSTSLPHHPK
ncbi:hypothetical protein EHQ46_16900 [Leptospira yanagawae]|uniref:Uncharacterized protein n=1 Tax=Leptospira yanagawae TaxID=293069 RepID=A0ABY2LX92_9LEPT|nr:hypothetical protein [Leptospira yanagawae]TGL17133.1 hypothetical protein EHQ46_16900 [Leptospira yanagawae]